MTDEKSVAMVKAVPMNEQSQQNSYVSYLRNEEEEAEEEAEEDAEEDAEEGLDVGNLRSNEQSVRTEDIGFSVEARSPPTHLRKDTCTRQLCFSSSQKMEDSKRDVEVDDTLQFNKESEL